MTVRGEARQYLNDVVLGYSGLDCLIWPYSRSRKGYGRVQWGGKNLVASRFVCEKTNGPPPGEGYEAAHSCGNGHLGCVNPKHLSWKTKVENQADRLTHGTDSRGPRHGLSRLTASQASEVLLLRGVETQQSIADRLGVTRGCIANVHAGRTWSWIDCQT